ncbi:hypothetical protein HDU96_009175 [Phlyctochytrium bullatum]|nr:hypothetical protein HDU96_009175 [Phlyctochytrium bullatum]
MQDIVSKLGSRNVEVLYSGEFVDCIFSNGGIDTGGLYPSKNPFDLTANDLQQANATLSIRAALETFDGILTKLTDGVVDKEISEEADLVREYFRLSPEFEDLLQLWDYQQDHNLTRIESAVPNVLHKAITCTKFLGGTRGLGTAVVRHVLRNRMRIVYRGIGSRRPALVAAMLRLLKAMAMQSASTTREMFEAFNFGLKVLGEVLKMRGRKKEVKRKVVQEEEEEEEREEEGEEGESEEEEEQENEDGEEKMDVDAQPAPEVPKEGPRDIYIQFLLGFLIYGDATLKKTALEAKGGLSAIFKGLRDDTVPTLSLIFSVFREKVLNDPLIPKSTKISFFNSYALEQITRLLSRVDPAVPVVGSDATASAKDLAQAFLKELCLVPGQGICHREMGWVVVGSDGEKKAGRNMHLVRWVRALRVQEEEVEMMLLVEVLKTYPSLIPAFCSHLPYSFEPRLSDQWTTNMALIARIIRLPLPDLTPLTIPNHTLSNPLVLDSLLPPCLPRPILSKGLQHRSQTVRNTAGLVLCFSLAKLEQLLDRAAALAAAADNVAAVAEARAALLEEAAKRVPDFQTVINFKAVILPAAETPAPDADSLLLDGVAAGAAKDEEDHDVTEEVLRSTYLRLLRLYVKLFPGHVEESRFDFAKLIPADLGDVPPAIRGHLVRLMGEVPSVRWWVGTPAKPSNLRSLLMLLRASQDPVERDTVRGVVRSLLCRGQIFREFNEEARVWLETVEAFGETGTTDAVVFFDEVVQHCMKQFIGLYDRASVVAQKGLMGMEEGRKRVYFYAVREVSRGRNVSGFPFSTAVVAALEVLAGHPKPLEKFGEGVKALWGLVGVVLKRVVVATQADAAFVVGLLESVVTEQEVAKEVVAAWVEHFKVFGGLVKDTPKKKTLVSAKKPRAGAKSKAEFYTAHLLDLEFKALENDLGDRALTDLWLDFVLATCAADPLCSHEMFQPNMEVLKADEVRRCITVCCFLLYRCGKAAGGASFPRDTCVALIRSLLKRMEEAENQDPLEVRAVRVSLLQNPFFVECFFAKAESAEEDCLDAFLLELLTHKDVTPRTDLTQPYVEKLASRTESQIQKKHIPSRLVEAWKLLAHIAPRDTVNDLLRLASSSRSGELTADVLDFILALCPRLLAGDNGKVTRLDKHVISRIVEVIPTDKDGTAISVASTLYNSLIGANDQGTALAAGVTLEASNALARYCDPAFLFYGEKVLSRLSSDAASGGPNSLLCKLVDHHPALAASVPVAATADSPHLLDLLVRNLPAGSGPNDKARAAAAAIVRTCLPRSLETGEGAGVTPAGLYAALVLFEGDAKAVLDSVYGALTRSSNVTGSVSVFFRSVKALGRWATSKPLACTAGLLKSFLWCVAKFVSTKDEEDGDASLENAALGLADLDKHVAAYLSENADSLLTAKDDPLPALIKEFFSKSAQNTNLEELSLFTCHFLLKVLKSSSRFAKTVDLVALSTSLAENPKFVDFLSGQPESESTDAKLDLLQSHFRLTPRGAAIALVHDLAELDPVVVCKLPLLKVLVQAYKGSRDLEDGLLTAVFGMYETKAGISVATHLIQGLVAKDAQPGQSKPVSASVSAKSIELLDSGKLRRLVHRFPVEEDLYSDEVEEDGERLGEEESVYSLQYLLPLLAHVVSSSQNGLDLAGLIASNALGVVVMCLTSLKPAVREAAYFILDLVYPMFKADESLKEGNQILLVLNRLKNTVVDRKRQAPRIPSVVGIFIAECLQIMTKPESPIYPLVNGFFLSRPLLDVEDYKPYRRRFVFDLLFTFYHSDFADPASKSSIMELLLSASAVPEIAYDLYVKHGLESFLSSMAATCGKSPDHAKQVAMFLLQTSRSVATLDKAGAAKLSQSLLSVGVVELNAILASVETKEAEKGKDEVATKPKLTHAGHHAAVGYLCELFTDSNSGLGLDTRLDVLVMQNAIGRLLEVLMLPSTDGKSAGSESRPCYMKVFRLLCSMRSRTCFEVGSSGEKPFFAVALPWLLEVSQTSQAIEPTNAGDQVEKSVTLFLEYLLALQQAVPEFLPRWFAKATHADEAESLEAAFCAQLLNMLSGARRAAARRSLWDTQGEERTWSLIFLAVHNYACLMRGIAAAISKGLDGFSEIAKDVRWKAVSAGKASKSNATQPQQHILESISLLSNLINLDAAGETSAVAHAKQALGTNGCLALHALFQAFFGRDLAQPTCKALAAYVRHILSSSHGDAEGAGKEAGEKVKEIFASRGKGDDAMDVDVPTPKGAKGRGEGLVNGGSPTKKRKKGK